MRKVFATLFCLTVILAVSDAMAFRFFLDKVPTRALSCQTCHLRPTGGTGWNVFGLAVQRVVRANGTFDFQTDLCRLDSDGDGLTNGTELLDPNCAWTENQQQLLGDATYPGDDTDPPPVCAAGTLGCACDVGDVCEQGLVCENRVCAQAPDPCANGGERCPCNGDDDCGMDLICENQVCVAGNRPDPCAAGDVGCACNMDDECAAGLVCENQRCAEDNPDPCAVGTLNCPCGAGDVCGADLVCENRVCVQDGGDDLCADWYYQVCDGDADCQRDGYVCGPPRMNVCTSSTCGCDPETGQAGFCTADCLQNARLCVPGEPPQGGEVAPPVGGMNEPNLCADWYYKTCTVDDDCERDGYVCGALIEDRCVAGSCGCDPATGQAGICTRDCRMNVGLCTRGDVMNPVGGNPGMGGASEPGGMSMEGGISASGGRPEAMAGHSGAGGMTPETGGDSENMAGMPSSGGAVLGVPGGAESPSGGRLVGGMPTVMEPVGGTMTEPQAGGQASPAAGTPSNTEQNAAAPASSSSGCRIGFGHSNPIGFLFLLGTIGLFATRRRR